MGELTFFLGLQVKQKEDGIFISQDKSMIGSLMYLTASRPDIMFAVCACSRFQVTPKTSHLSAVKRIFRNPQHEVVVNFLGWENSSRGSAKSSTLWLLLLLEARNILSTLPLGNSFIKDAYEKKLIQGALKFHTDDNVADLLTKAFDVSRGLKGFRELLSRATDGTEALLLPTLFFLWLDKVSTASAKLLPLGKVCTALELLTWSPTWRSLKGMRSFTTFSDFPKASSNPFCSYWKTLTAKVAGKSLSILRNPSESDLLLNDAEWDRQLPNQSKQTSFDVSVPLDIFTVSYQAKEIQALKAQITKLKKQAKPFAKEESSVQRDPLFDEMPEDTIDHMETENAESEGRTREMRILMRECLVLKMYLVLTRKELGAEDQVKGTDEHNEGTEDKNEGTDEIFEGTEEQREGTEEKVESTDGQVKGTEDQTEEEIDTQTSTQTPTSMIFGDDETIAKVLLNMSQAKAVSKEKEKGVELKDVEETDRPKPTSTRSLLTLKPLPKIDPKDKGKKKIEEEDESESESDGIPQAEKKFKQLESDEELARKIQEEIEADRLLAEKLQEQEREQFTIEERAKFLHDTIAAQRKFLAQQRSEAIRNKPPTKNQLRNQMMTYLKHVGNYKHAELKIKKFEEVQALYEKIKRSDEDFISIGSAEDERLIKRMNERGVDLSKSEVIKEESKEEVKEEDKDEESTRKRKLGTRKKMKSRKRRYIQNTSEDDSDKENDELRLYLTIAPDEEKEVDYEILDRKYPIKEWKTECLGTKPQTDQAEHLEEINLNVVIRSNGQKRYFSTLMSVLSIFDREDLDAVYQLVMNRFQDEMPEGFDRVLWGDLMVLFNSDDKDVFWSSQQDWKIVSWKLHSSSGVHTIVTETELVIHMLVEKKYPLRKEVLMQMLKLKLESEEDSTIALELIRFIKRLLVELELEEKS
ncbi:hypothetical protein Tco_0446872 [Tanacetum coccineum]